VLPVGQGRPAHRDWRGAAVLILYSRQTIEIIGFL